MRAVSVSALAATLLLAAPARPQAPPAKAPNPPLKEVPVDLDLSDPKAKPDPIIYVEPPESNGDAKLEFPTGLLRRELYRQAFLLAARDEFGLTVRDGTLGEVPPDDLRALTNQFRVSARFSRDRRHEAAVEVGPPAASRKAWQAVATGDPGDWEQPLAALVAAEGLSRGGYVTALKRAGHRPRPNPVDPKAAVPAGVGSLLGQMTFTAQFAAVRQLHEALRTKGESVATLGALSRAYANLGMLTDTQMGAAPWVYKARGLLYAERLRQRDPAKPWGLWHRAYAAALAGMHAEALADLKAADAARGTVVPPDWVPLVDAVCRFDSAKLSAAAKDGPLADTAAVFHFLTVEDTKSPNLALAVGEAVVKRIPECYRVHDALAETGGVGAQHRTTLAGLEIMTKTFPARVAEMPGLPKVVADAVQTGAPEPDLLKALTEAGKARDDRAEPSWAALGQFAREARVVQAYRRLVFLRYKYSVPVDEFLAEMKPLVAGHPLFAYLETFRFDPERDKAEIQKRLRGLKVPELTYRHGGLVAALGRLGPNERVRYSTIATEHGDNLYYDDYLLLRLFRPEQNTGPFARRMLEHSPYAPIARAAVIAHDWAYAKARAADWEREAQHPDVFLAMGRRAIADNRLDDAERLLGRAIELSPDQTIYRVLADAYKKKGDTDKWLATLERYLKEPDPGLGHAQVRVEIAEHFMAKKDYPKAKPYADAAAETYAGWAMLCAAKCEEGLGQWDAAEQWVRRVAERYDDSPQVWCLWCLRTGRGDRAAARAHLEEYLKKHGPPRTARDNMLRGVLHVADGEPVKAAERFIAANAAGKHDVYLMSAALEYDATGDAAERDKVLAQVSTKGPYDPVVALLRATLAKGAKEVPTAAEIEAALKPLTPGGQTESRYFVGRFLKNRGQPAAADYLKAAAGPASPFALAPTLAGLALQEADRKK